MPDRRRHRGPHPSDETLFTAGRVPDLRRAVHDLSWLLSRGYPEKSAAKVVGDRYGLRQRQRVAVMRSACPDEARDERRLRALGTGDVAGRAIELDGYNVLTSVEAALAGGVLLLARDGCLRDMASMHGSWRKVDETGRAIELVGETLDSLHAGPVTWYLDAPVSNSGRLATLIRETGVRRGWSWRVELVPDPDPVLAASDGVVATADSAVLDGGGPWLNLARIVVERHVPDAWILDLEA